MERIKQLRLTMNEASTASVLKAVHAMVSHSLASHDAGT